MVQHIAHNKHTCRCWCLHQKVMHMWCVVPGNKWTMYPSHKFFRPKFLHNSCDSTRFFSQSSHWASYLGWLNMLLWKFQDQNVKCGGMVRWSWLVEIWIYLKWFNLLLQQTSTSTPYTSNCETMNCAGRMWGLFEMREMKNILGNFKFKFNFLTSTWITSGLVMTTNKVLWRPYGSICVAILEIISLVDLNWMASDVSWYGQYFHKYIRINHATLNGMIVILTYLTP